MSLRVFIGRAFRGLVWGLLAVGVLLLVWIWLVSDLAGQEKMMTTVPLVALMGVLAVLALFMVRGPWRKAARATA